METCKKVIPYNKLNNYFYDWFYKIPLLKKPRGNSHNRIRCYYIDIVSAFDIETTRLHDYTKQQRDQYTRLHNKPIDDNAVMYIWQWAFMDQDYNYIVVYGREWADFIMFYRKLTMYMDDKTRMVTYVHNLSYEFQFLRGIIPFGSNDVFCVDNRQPLKAVSRGIEFRCSYKLSNMSLRKFAESEHCTNLKTELNYMEKRYSYTELSSGEIEYCINDVICLCEAVIRKMQHDNDTLYTIPLTSTGYVRREVKKVVTGRPQLLKKIREMYPDRDVYNMLKQAFRGGNTHANRYYADTIIDNKYYGMVHSADRSSSYPAVICNNLYPMSVFESIENPDIKKIYHYIYDLNRAVLMTIGIYDLRLNDISWGCPYISRSKCSTVSNGVFDNGRVLSADYVELTITDVDFKIIQEEYKGDFIILKASSAKYGKLPQCIIDTVIKYYRGKTELKGVDGQEYFYMKSKNLLNSIYGMMVQDPAKDLILFEHGDERHVESGYAYEGKGTPEILEKARKKAFLNYAWGVWVTAWARYELERGIEIASADGCQFLYCDTDSVKYIGDADFSKYNAEKIEESKASGSYATDPKGTTHYMGVFESEHDMHNFKTLGAKKYAYTDDKGFHITVAGVGKSKGAKEIESYAEKHGKPPIDCFNVGFVFSDAGSLEAVYNDIPLGDFKTENDSNGIETYIISNVCLRPTTYTLGITAEYRDIINAASAIIGDDIL